jgi:hypothetical protein
MSKRLNKIEARLLALPAKWQDWTPLMLDDVIEHYHADTSVLVAVARAAEALYPYASTLTRMLEVNWQPFTGRGQESYTAIIKALEGIESAVKALDAKEARSDEKL